MARRPFDLIAFDGDDTLWHNERSYRDGREQFRRLLAGAGVDLSADAVEAHVNRTELANLAFFGYGVSSFVLSLIETAIDLTGGRISGADLRGSPTPSRRKPSKLNNAGVLSGLMLFALLKGHKPPGRIGDEGAGETGLDVAHLDVDTRQDTAARIDDGTVDDAGRDLGLS